jgi:hypothetical protein
MRHSVLCVVATLVSISPAVGQRDPPLPPGRDPGGVAIALVGTGIDYTLPEVARRLARDGEGELIGWDLVDNDNRPYHAGGDAGAWGGEGNALVRAIGAAGRRIVPVRIDSDDSRSLARAVAFVAQTPARIVVVPTWSRKQSDWEPFRQAAIHFKDLLFFVAAGDEGEDIDREPVWPAAFGLANVLVVSAVASGAYSAQAPNAGAQQTADALVALPTIGRAGEAGPPSHTSLAAVLAADALAGCWPRLVEAHRGAALKKAFLAEAAKTAARNTRPVIERCAR